MPEWKREIDELQKLAQHLQDRYEELLLSGETPADAHSTVLAELSEHESLSSELRPAQREPVVAGGDRSRYRPDCGAGLYAVRVQSAIRRQRDGSA